MRFGSVFVFVIWLAAIPALAGRAHASDPPPAKGTAQGHDAAKHDDGHKGDGGPFAGEVHQILDLAIWTIVVFLLLYLVLHRFAWKPMLTGLQQRETNIRSALDEAEKARGEAKALMASLDKERSEAAGKVKAIIDEAKRDAQTTADDLLTKARADITNERERLRREIQIEVDQAMQSLWSKTASLATQVAGKAIRKDFNADQQRRLIDEAVSELRKTSV